MTGLTEELVRELAANPGKADLMRPDRKGSGLWFRVRNGQARWYLQWRDDDGRQRRLTLGKYPAMKLAAARAAAKSKGADVEKGDDPHKAKRERREAAKQTFGVLVDKYLDGRRPLTADEAAEPSKIGKKRLKERSYSEVQRHLKKHAKSLHSKPVDSITVADIHDLIEGIARSWPVAADAVRTSIGAFFVWAMKRGRAKQNPVARTEAPIDRAARARDRRLTDDELRSIWPHLRDDDHGRLMRLLALTGQRRSEAGGMRWSEIQGLVWRKGATRPDLDVPASREAIWIIPPERAKNGREHAVPLSRQCLEILAAVEKRDDRDLIFGLKGPFSGWSRAKSALDKRVEDARAKAELPKLKPWTPHDFRRTFATVADEGLGVQPFVVDALLSHTMPSADQKLSGSAKVYNLSTYLPEKRQALDMWGEHLLAIVEGRKSNVVPLRPGIAA